MTGANREGNIDNWAYFVPPEELETYRKAAFGNPIGIGDRPTLLNVETANHFVDPRYKL